MERFKQRLTALKDHGRAVKREVQRQVLGYMLAALGLVAGLAWNEAIKESIEYLFPLGKNTLLAKFSYAGLITLVAVIISIYLTRLLGEKEKREQEEKKTPAEDE